MGPGKEATRWPGRESMAQYKSQHQVPRFYLKHFASDPRGKSIGLFHVPTGMYVPNARIKNQACRDYFYGREPMVEQALALIEGFGSRLISEIIREQQLPHDPDAWRFLIFYIVLQHERTVSAAEAADEAAGELAQIVLSKDPELAGVINKYRVRLRDPALFMLGSVASGGLWNLGFDLKGRLLRTDADHPFITSDAPVVHYNQFMEGKRHPNEHLGLACKGLQILFPLSPQWLLLLYDDDVYFVDGPARRGIPVSRADVDELNLLHCAWANQTLYFCARTTDRQYMEGLVEQAMPLRREDKAEVDEYRAADGSPSSLVALNFPGIACELKLSMVRVRKKARKERLDRKVCHVRNRELLDQVIRAFDQVTRRPKPRPGDSGPRVYRHRDGRVLRQRRP